MIDKLFLELSQVTLATTPRERNLQARVDCLLGLAAIANAIAEREGSDTDWDAFRKLLRKHAAGLVPVYTYKLSSSSAPAS